MSETEQRKEGNKCLNVSLPFQERNLWRGISRKVSKENHVPALVSAGDPFMLPHIVKALSLSLSLSLSLFLILSLRAFPTAAMMI